jgi:inhibitor of cysteine peptidase
MRMRRVILSMAGFGLLLLAAGSPSLFAESGAQATSGIYLVPGDVVASIGGLVFESGSRLALELAGAGSSGCFGSPILVEGIELSDAAGRALRSESYVPAVDASEWTGRVELLDDQGAAFPQGNYELSVSTSVGRFTAGFSILDAGRFPELGHGSATASICGVSLRVYRLLTEADAGTLASLRVGDRLMVELEGNPTTGYVWENSLTYEYAILRESQEVEFRPSSGLLGAGGRFLFRYYAVDVGVQAFRFVYHRPWESTEPDRIVTFDVRVY